jgi:hypothetical protein
VHIRTRNSPQVRALAAVHPVAPATAPDASLTGWVVLIVLVAAVVLVGAVLASRR